MALRYQRMTSASGASRTRSQRHTSPRSSRSINPCSTQWPWTAGTLDPGGLEKPVHVQEGELIERFAEHR